MNVLNYLDQTLKCLSNFFCLYTTLRKLLEVNNISNKCVMEAMSMVSIFWDIEVTPNVIKTPCGSTIVSGNGIHAGVPDTSGGV